MIGADNVYRDIQTQYPRPSVEDVLKRDPHMILVLAMGENHAAFERMATAWKRFSKLKAVRNGQVKVIESDALVRPTLRLLDGLKTLKKAVYGGS